MATALERQKADNTAAAALEVLPGFFFHTFGIGHIYQGRVKMGLFIMLSYWTLQLINAFLSLFLIGLLTGGLTYLFYLVAATHNAYDFEPSR